MTDALSIHVKQPVSEHRALEIIASASPSLHRHGHGEVACAVCATHIDLAREALGCAPLPAAPGTPADADGSSQGQRS